MNTLLILLISILPLAWSSCPANYDPSDIRSGFVVASTISNVDVNIISATTTYIHSLNSPLLNIPQVAIATNMIEGPLRKDQSYWVSANGSQSQITFIFNLSYSSNNWYIMKIGFIAETRTDIQIGIVQMSGLTSQSKTFNKSLSRSIPNPFILTFISGFLVTGSNSPISFELINASALNNTILLSSKSNNIGTVWINYIVYNPSSLRGAYTVSSGSVALGQFDVSNNQLQAGTTFIFGFNEFSTLQSAYFSIESRLLPMLLIKTMSKYLSSVSVDYFIIQNLPQFYCSQCRSGFIYDQGYCVTVCGQNSVVIISDSSQSCLLCDISSYFIKSIDNSTCNCAIQYQQSSGTQRCKPCHSSCITCSGPSRNNCLSCDSTPPLPTNKILVNSTCVCSSKFYEDPSNIILCVPCHYSCLTCSGNNFSNCLTCSTNFGRVKSGNTCSCTNGYRDDGSNEKCICVNTSQNGSCISSISCQSNQQKVNNLCQCKSGYFNISGRCSQCQNNNYFNGIQCVLCSNGTVSTDKTKCSCANTYYNISGKCQRCLANQVYNNKSKSCNCITGYYRVSNICKKPPSNTTYNGTTFICSTGLFNISGKCTACPQNQVYNQTSRTCNCPFGTALRNGRCQTTSITNITKCPLNSFLNGKVCSCSPGYFNISGQCKSCPSGAIYNGFQCLCPSNTLLKDNNCISCPQGSYLNGQTCVCLQGWIFVNNTCTMSTSNVSNSSTLGTKKVILTNVGYMRLTGYFVCKVSLSYIPAAYLANNCAACSNLLDVKITGGAIRPTSTAFSFSSPNIINIFFSFNTPVPQPFTASVRIEANNFYEGYDISDSLNFNITNSIISSSNL